MPQPLPTLLSLLLLVAVTSASSLVKRDVLGDLEDTMTDWKDQVEDQIDQVVGNDKNVVDQIKDEIEKNCFMDEPCLEPIQHCVSQADRLNLVGKCEFHVWFWIVLAGAVAVLFCSCITSTICCCCSSLCRKAT